MVCLEWAYRSERDEAPRIPVKVLNSSCHRVLFIRMTRITGKYIQSAMSVYIQLKRLSSYQGLTTAQDPFVPIGLTRIGHVLVSMAEMV